jgi:hypothetical protein
VDLLHYIYLNGVSVSKGLLHARGMRERVTFVYLVLFLKSRYNRELATVSWLQLAS